MHYFLQEKVQFHCFTGTQVYRVFSSVTLQIWCLSIRLSLSPKLIIPDQPTTTIKPWVYKWHLCFSLHGTQQGLKQTQYAETHNIFELRKNVIVKAAFSPVEIGQSRKAFRLLLLCLSLGCCLPAFSLKIVVTPVESSLWQRDCSASRSFWAGS